jgi:hypothetical protein
VTTPAITDTTRVHLHELQVRRDGLEWCVGRLDAGDFVVLPEVGACALRLLRDGRTVQEVRERLRGEHGRDIDVEAFLASLVDLGFVAAVDGQPVPGPAARPPALPWLRPADVRWLLSPWTGGALVVLVALGVAAAVAVPDAVPGRQDLVWSRWGSLVLAGNAAVAWTLIFLHELAHLATARAAGVPGTIGLDTRLHFLVAQTDVTGVWASPRRVRITVYLAGIALNLAAAATAVVARGVTGPDGPAGRGLAVVAALSLVLITPQFLVFMRTDLYFLLQDLSGCRNLYADGSAYGRYLAVRVPGALVRRAGTRSDPSLSLPGRERGMVRAYAGVLILGTAAYLAALVLVVLPVTVTLLARAARNLTGAGGAAGHLDALVTLLIIGGFSLIWCRAWWRRHGPRVRGACQRRPSRPSATTDHGGR